MSEHEGEDGPRIVAGVVIGERAHRISGRLFLGIALVLVGLLWTMQNLGEPLAGIADQLLPWWPVLLVVYGVLCLTGGCPARSRMRGTFFIAVGMLLLAAHLVHLHAGFGTLFALLIVCVGVVLVWRSLPWRETGPNVLAGGENIRLVAVVGAAIHRVVGQPVRRGELYAVMGGIELDLRESKPATDRVEMEVFAFAGGIEIYVPETWRVESEVVPLAGAFEDRTTRASAEPPACTLVLRGVALLGGVVARNQPSQDREVRIRRRRRRGEYEEVHVSPFGVSVRRRPAPPDAGSDPWPTGAPPRPGDPQPPVEPS